MKDSGVAWLGQVPEHWGVRRLRTIVDMRVSTVDKLSVAGEVPVRLCNYVDVYKHDLINNAIAFMEATATPAEIERFRLRAGDVLITKDSETWNDIGVPAFVEQTAEDVVCGYHLALLRSQPRQVLGGYLLRATQSQPIAQQLHIEANGVTRYGLTHEAINSVLLPLPPLSEQTDIVRFLNHADRRIGRIIRCKQRLVNLLKEERGAVLYRAVTRGLEPTVPLKSSGVPWLGDVPEHWQIMPLRRASGPRCDGPFGSSLKSGHYTDHGVRVIRLQNIGHGEFNGAGHAYVGVEHYATLGDHSVEAGDLLIAGLGDSRRPAGRACLAPVSIGPAMVKADCFRFRLLPGVLDPEFAAQHLTATAAVASSVMTTGATRQRINLQAMAGRSVGVPPMLEQISIIRHVMDKTAPSVHATKVILAAIDALRECCQCLISDVVTGKC